MAKKTQSYINEIADKTEQYLKGEISEEDLNLKENVFYNNSADAERYLDALSDLDEKDNENEGTSNESQFRIVDVSKAEIKDKPLKLNGLKRFTLKSAFKGIKDNSNNLKYIKAQFVEVNDEYKGRSVDFEGVLEGFASIYIPEGLIEKKDDVLYINPIDIKDQLSETLKAAANYLEYKEGDGEYAKWVEVNDRRYHDWQNVDNTRFRITPEEKSIIEKAKTDGTYMKAPNGKSTNLNEKQWVQVRTKAFKKWFGDWENDADKVSKIVDENGEPLVVYHGTQAEFNEFSNSFNDKSYEGFFFTDDKKMAESYGNNVMEVFLNIRDAFEIEGNGRNWNDLNTDIISLVPRLEDKIILHEASMKKAVEKGEISQSNYDFFKNKYYDKVAFIKDKSKNSIIDIIKKYIYSWQIRNFDSSHIASSTREIEYYLEQLENNTQIIFKNIKDYGEYSTDNKTPHNVYVTTSSNQIKSATDNVGTFDEESNDIRFRISKTPQEFDATQKEAVEKRGIVTPNLNNAVVNVVYVPRHDFTGNLKEARNKAREWAIEHYTGKEFDLPDNSGKYIISKNAIDKYLDKSAFDKSDNAAIHLSALKVLPDIISNSVEAEIHADYAKDENGNRSAKNGVKRNDLLVHRIYGAINIEGNIYRVKTTIHEFKDANTANSPHSYEVTKIELIEDSTVTPNDGIDNPLNRSVNSISATKLLNGVEKSYDKGKKVLDESRSTENIEDVRFRVTNQNQEIFVSNAAKAVENIKQEKATPQQWLAMIEKNGGLKAGEDKWIGLSDWLKSSDAKTITKNDLLNFIYQNKIKIEEVRYGDWDITKESIENSPEFKSLVDDLSEYDSKGKPYISKERFNYLKNETEDFYSGFSLKDGKLIVKNAYGAALYLGLSPKLIDGTRLDYTTEGLQNKKEIALVVPTIESWKESDEVHFGDAGKGRAVAWIRFGDTYAYTNEEYSREVTEFKEPFKNVSGHEVYVADNETKNDYVVHGKGRNGEWIYVAFVNGKEIPVAHKSLEDAKEEMNKYYKEHPIKSNKQSKILVIDEIQSNRHQVGRENGYYDSKEIADLKQELYQAKIKRDTEWDILSEKYKYPLSSASEEELKEWRFWEDKATEIDKKIVVGQRVPAAPFEKNWSELAMKRMLRFAAENGYDKVAWTKGTQQAERYNLGNSVDNISSEPYGVDDNGDAIRLIRIRLKGEMDGIHLEVNKDGIIETGGQDFEGRNLGEIVGKEAAIKLMSYDTTISGDGLHFGGEGMKGFYDKMLPSFVNKYVKKWGTKVQDIELPEVEESGKIMHSIDVTEAMKESVMDGQTMFRMMPNNEQNAEEEKGIEETVNELSKILNTPVEIIRDVNEIHHKNKQSETRRRKAKGWFEPNTGKVVIVLPNATSEADIQATMLHEIVAHKGLKEMLGKDNFNSLCDNVFNSLPKEIQERLYKKYKSKTIAGDEYMASIAEKGIEPNQWQKVKAIVKQAFRAIGIDLKISDNDIAYLLWKSKNRLMNGDTELDIINKIAKDEDVKETLYRDSDNSREMYNKAVTGKAFVTQEAFQDSMLALKKLQEVVEEVSGKKIQSYENAYDFENRLSSMNTNAQRDFYDEHIVPIEKAIHKLMTNGATYDDVKDYLIAKHGLERNQVLARRDAQRKAEQERDEELKKVINTPNISDEERERRIGKINNQFSKALNNYYNENRENDYSGLTSLMADDNEKIDVKEAEKRAEEFVNEFEKDRDTNLLWIEINKATNSTLRKSFDSGVISKETYERTKDMFEYYVPLRGWEEETAEDIY